MKTLIALTMLASLSFAQESGWQPLWQPKENTPGYDAAMPPENYPDAEHVTNVHLPEYRVFLPEGESDKPRPAVCIFPGGGYQNLALTKEGEEIGRWLASQGFVGMAVKYRVSADGKHPEAFPHQLMDARRAIRTLRAHAKEWNVDPNKIGVIGFSAGGHLAALATTWKDDVPGETKDTIDKESLATGFAMLIYPVISMDKPYVHGGSKNALLGQAKDAELVKKCSPYLQVTRQTPPLFVVQSADDGVSALNSLDMVRAAQEKGVPVEYHLYRKGGHGYGMRKQNKPTDAWPQEAEKWLKQFKQ